MRVEDDTLSFCAEARKLLIVLPIVRQNINFPRRRRPWLPVDAEDFDFSLLAKKPTNLQRRGAADAMAARADF